MGKDTSPSRQAMTTAAELRVLLGQLRRRLREEASTGNFNLSQRAVMLRLDRDGPTTVTLLARAEGVRPQSMSTTVAALQSVGFINTAPHPTDGRQTLLTLTPASHAWIKANRAAREDWLSRGIQRQLSPAEQKQLAHAVQLLKRLVEP
ncbi:MarR family winged helix-turn-helix transcriptional regulator [Dyella caseinilytica]|uniref:MarR family transcriptional regulator n=1 Tax=Dyella caseinilytica TaxID=1849581 RepID=A0ABX7GWZ6_9GAMM|nr:MarR family transcriptional regulator [Dyella caseinilytica]QRN54794.1 MarR family transcriptional regulator [Dyella caseinilytica]